MSSESSLQQSEVTNDVEEQSNLNYENWNGVDIIQSLCMRCGATGETRLMLHKIPHFRELVIASFRCDECGEHNNEVTFGGEIQLQGCIYQLKVTTAKDLNRQIIKSDSACVRIPELEFEIPAHTQKGEINTLEGVLRTAAKNLGLFQAERMADNPEVGMKVAHVIARLMMMADGDVLPFHIDLDDPAGNSYLENPLIPQADPHMKLHHYHRTKDQDIALGLDPEKGVYKDDAESNYMSLLTKTRAVSPPPQLEGEEGEAEVEGEHVQLGRGEAVSIPSVCPHCGMEGQSLTALTDIPHFKEVIIMAFDCKQCGFRTNDVKAGGAVPVRGTEVQLIVTSPDDLKRDLLKSDSAMVKIPELELELVHGSLGGMFTTVEGLLQKILKNLHDQNPILLGDSSSLHHSEDVSIPQAKSRFLQFLQRLERFAKGEEMPFTLCLRDPLGNSFISAPLGTSLPPELDVNLTLTDYDRSFEDNEEFGLNDLNTKDYEVLPENVEDGPVLLADRLTNVYIKQADHPTFFAKGTNDHDNTSNGVFFDYHESKAVATEKEGGEEVLEYCSPPSGWVAERHDEEELNLQRILEDENKRYFTDDSDLEFIPRESFYTQREGFVFRMGSKGLGYYTDRGPMTVLKPL